MTVTIVYEAGLSVRGEIASLRVSDLDRWDVIHCDAPAWQLRQRVLYAFPVGEARVDAVLAVPSANSSLLKSSRN